MSDLAKTTESDMLLPFVDVLLLPVANTVDDINIKLWGETNLCQ